MKEVFYLGTLILQLFFIKLKPLLHEVWILLKKRGVEGRRVHEVLQYQIISQAHKPLTSMGLSPKQDLTTSVRINQQYIALEIIVYYISVSHILFKRYSKMNRW